MTDLFPIATEQEIQDTWGSDLVLVDRSRRWANQLTWRNADQDMLVSTYADYLSRYGMLNELFMLEGLVTQMRADGLRPVFTEDTAPVLYDFARWHAPLKIEGLTLRRSDGTPSDLYDYQRFSINRAMERISGRYRHDRFFFFGWGLGTGKSAACAAGALEAMNRGHVDLVLAFTMRKLKLNLRDFFTKATPLDVAVCDGTKERRRKLWSGGHQVYVNNYDKAWWDREEIAKLTKDRRVLFIFDEVEVLLTADKRTRVRKAMDELMAKSHSTAWPMSGSIVDATPLTYHDNYSLGCTSAGTHPMGTRKSFIDLYRSERESTTYPNPHGPGFFTVHTDHWDNVGLQEVRHRVAHCTQNARKTDPGVRENFPGISTEVVRIQLSDQDRQLYEILRERRAAAMRRREPTGEHLECMRYLCNHPGALGITRYPLGQELAAAFPKLITGKNCSKLEVFCDQVEAVAAAGEQCIGFTKWTGLSLHLVATELERRKIRFVLHHGAMSDRAAYDAQEAHRADPGITLFWSSDAGSHGLNMQHCRTVINYECPRAWKRLNQRMSRIDRADGGLDGRTNYIYVTDRTIEVGIKETNDRRRALAGATMGTAELDSYDNNERESVGSWGDELELLIASEERDAV